MGRLFEAICGGGMNAVRYRVVMDYVREQQFELTLSPYAPWALEIGCDDGAYALSFAMMGYRVTALDPARTPFMAHLYDYHPVSLDNWLHGTPAYQCNRHYEIVHLGEVIEHVRNPDQFLSRACGVCKGKMIVSAPNFNAVGHRRTYEWQEFLDFVGEFVEIEGRARIESNKKPGKFQWLAMGTPK